MRSALRATLATTLIIFCGCKRASPSMEYAPTGTIRDLMKSLVEPNADFVWDSFATILTLKGEERRIPRTQEEWETVRSHGVALVEVANLLLIPNRHVAKPGEPADNPGVEREPREIEAMMKNDRATFLNRIAGLRQASTKMLRAVETKDMLAINEAAGELDKACENCHVTYWYLHEAPK